MSPRAQSDQDNGAPRYPRRHGSDVERARKVAALLLRSLPGGTAPTVTEADWRLYGEGLLVGDPVADTLVAWMHEVGMRQAWPLVNRGIDAGLSAVPEAPEPLRAFLQTVETRPAWVDADRLLQGARVCNLGGLAAMRGLLVTGLMAGYQLAAINQTLLATGALDKGAARRVAETTTWWVHVTTPGSMEPLGEGFRSTVRVRLIHALVRREVGRRPSWDVDDLGVPVSQTDMQITYLGFSVIYLLSMRLVGVWVPAREREDVMHLWRYIAWLMGVQEPFLHELVQGEQSALQHFYKNMVHQRMWDADSARLAQALADEALHRRYDSFAALQGWYNRALQLSFARLCMSPESLQALGLEVPAFAWYPLLVAPVNVALHGVARLVPGGRDWLVRRGQRQQRGYLGTLFGREAPGVRPVQNVVAFGV